MSECLFCRIVSREIPARIVAEDRETLAFQDIRPQAPTHVLIIPKTHLPTVAHVTENTASVVVGCVLMANAIAKQAGVAEDGYRLVINCGSQAGQTVWHLHVHLLAGRPMTWPPG